MNDIYPNSPLKEVVLEVRFPGEPAVETHRDEFFDLARSEFPQVLVPHLQPGEAVALQPYHFRSEDESKSLILALNRFAFTSRMYPGWEAFSTEALGWLERFGKLFHLSKLSRTGLRYINQIPFPPGQDLPVRRFLNLELVVGHAVERMQDVFLALVVPAGDGSLTVRIGTEQSDPGRGIMILDFDFAHAGSLSFSEAASYFESSHAETKRFFERLITDEYRDYLKGDEIE